MNSLEGFVVIITVISIFLVGYKNNWMWFFTILANVIWLIIGLQRGITVIIISSVIYLALSFRGAYLWIFKNKEVKMATFPKWVESWQDQYKEEVNCEVLKADISMILKKGNGEIIIRKSEYRSNNLPEIKLADKLPSDKVICG